LDGFEKRNRSARPAREPEKNHLKGTRELAQLSEVAYCPLLTSAAGTGIWNGFWHFGVTSAKNAEQSKARRSLQGN
jgi:hypothetical protein